jgi:hypothetical protein
MFMKILSIVLALFSVYYACYFLTGSFSSNEGNIYNIIFFGVFLVQTYGNIKLFQLSRK